MAGAARGAPGKSALDQLTVTLGKVVFSSDGDEGGGGFAVWQVADDAGGSFRATADLAADSWGQPGDRVVLVGKWVDDSRRGRQFAAESIRPHVEEGIQGQLRWLTSHRGVGPATARLVLTHLGNNSLERLVEDPDLLGSVPGLQRERAEAVLRAVADYVSGRQKADVLIWAHAHGFGPHQADAIWEAFRAKAPEILTREPWQLARLPGFGFARADSLARDLEVAPGSPARLRAALHFVLSEAAEVEGHVWLAQANLISQTQKLLSDIAQKTSYGSAADWSGPQLATALQACVTEETLTMESERCYLPKLFKAEKKVRTWLARRARQVSGLLPLERAAEIVCCSEVIGNLDEVQASAVILALSAPISVLTGGPGTGKTTTVKAILSAIRLVTTGRGPDDSSPRVLLAAPTGRAAQRLSEVAGHPASTLHRLLDYGPLPHGGMGPRHNAEDPLAGAFLIVDESSMCDIVLLASTVDAIPDAMPVLWVGDADQLPPVGPGAPFHALVHQGLAPVVTLERIYRQGEGSPIPVAARAVNAGRVPPSGSQPGLQIRVYPRPARNLPDQVREEKLREARSRLQEDILRAVAELRDQHGFLRGEIQVLTPVRRGPCGVGELNKRLRLLLNPEGHQNGQLSVGKRDFWMGDRVMQVVNNYDKLVWNGETGVVVRTDHTVEVTDRRGNIQYKPGILVRFDDGRELGYWAGDASELTLAYAITVHKSQGSEYPAVVMVLTWDSYMLLERQLVYTGMTRAARHLVLLTERGTLERAVVTTRGVERCQALVA